MNNKKILVGLILFCAMIFGVKAVDVKQVQKDSSVVESSVAVAPTMPMMSMPMSACVVSRGGYGPFGGIDNTSYNYDISIEENSSQISDAKLQVNRDEARNNLIKKLSQTPEYNALFKNYKTSQKDCDLANSATQEAVNAAYKSSESAREKAQAARSKLDDFILNAFAKDSACVDAQKKLDLSKAEQQFDVAKKTLEADPTNEFWNQQYVDAKNALKKLNGEVDMLVKSADSTPKDDAQPAVDIPLNTIATIFNKQSFLFPIKPD
jgi:hypothetical protein